ncbi:unnamed protein product [Arabidopsis halleri]
MSGFRDFLLKQELLRAIVDSGFEHPSEGNYNTYPSFEPSFSYPCLAPVYYLFWISLCITKCYILKQ